MRQPTQESHPDTKHRDRSPRNLPARLAWASRAGPESRGSPSRATGSPGQVNPANPEVVAPAPVQQQLSLYFAGLNSWKESTANAIRTLARAPAGFRDSPRVSSLYPNCSSGEKRTNRGTRSSSDRLGFVGKSRLLRSGGSSRSEASNPAETSPSCCPATWTNKES